MIVATKHAAPYCGDIPPVSLPDNVLAPREFTYKCALLPKGHILFIRIYRIAEGSSYLTPRRAHHYRFSTQSFIHVHPQLLSPFFGYLG